MITITDLRKVYQQGGREVTALDGVSLSVPKGSIHGIIGHSGAGKSTLVRCLTLLDRPTSGRVEINGVDLSSVSNKEIRQARRKVGMVFQHANLLDSRTVAANVAHPLEIVGTNKAQIDEKIRQLLPLVGLEGFENAYPAQLSGGQRQRVGIARALAADPDVLLCDEPTSALDPATTEEILDLIKNLTVRLDLTVVIITHEMHVVKRACDSVSLLEQGKIVEHGSLQEISENADGQLAQALLPLPAVANPENQILLDIVFSAHNVGTPVLSGLARKFDIDVNVISGSIEPIGGQQFGRLRIGLWPETDVEAVIRYLEELGVSVGRPGLAHLGATDEEASA
ncbi:methionine ABC transporter ATP-binding protein [Renibacterium salmoninarum]|nr:ATP-binding cassette domain-containing protein [Renibacterium salmoninarum]